MVNRRYSYRRSSAGYRPFVAFLLVASFGILFAGCKGPENVGENKDYVFTQENLDQAHQLAKQADEKTGSGLTGESLQPHLEAIDGASGGVVQGEEVVLDLSMVDSYKSVRTSGTSSVDREVYQVTNEFLNVREKMATNAAQVSRLSYGDTLEVLSFPSAVWAEVRLKGGQKGYVSTKYIAKMVSDDQLSAEKEKYAGQFFVQFQFVNVRKEPNQKSEKLGQINGQTILKPYELKDGWARVTSNGLTGYVAMSYLKPFLPRILVRQHSYQLPVLIYRLSPGQDDAMLQTLITHAAALKKSGVTFTTFAKFRDLLLAQQQRDVRIAKNSVIVGIAGITSQNAQKVSDALLSAGINATLFIETRNVGLRGITEKMLLRLVANGFDIASATHTGDDLRALTNAQVTLELRQSRKILEDVTRKSVFAVLYPVGGTNDRVMQIAGDSGYLFGVTTGTDITFTRDQLLNVPSTDVFQNMSETDVVHLVTAK